MHAFKANLCFREFLKYVYEVFWNFQGREKNNKKLQKLKTKNPQGEKNLRTCGKTPVVVSLCTCACTTLCAHANESVGACVALCMQVGTVPICVCAQCMLMPCALAGHDTPTVRVPSWQTLPCYHVDGCDACHVARIKWFLKFINWAPPSYFPPTFISLSFYFHSRERKWNFRMRKWSFMEKKQGQMCRSHQRSSRCKNPSYPLLGIQLFTNCQ